MRLCGVKSENHSMPSVLLDADSKGYAIIENATWNANLVLFQWKPHKRSTSRCYILVSLFKTFTRNNTYLNCYDLITIYKLDENNFAATDVCRFYLILYPVGFTRVRQEYVIKALTSNSHVINISTDTSFTDVDEEPSSICFDKTIQLFCN